MLLGVGHVAPFQGFEVQANRGDRRFQFVGHRVDEAVVLLVATDLPHQKTGVDDHPGDDQRKENNAEEQQDAFAPVQDDPADVERDGQRHQANAQDQEEGNRFAAVVIMRYKNRSSLILPRPHKQKPRPEMAGAVPKILCG